MDTPTVPAYAVTITSPSGVSHRDVARSRRTPDETREAFLARWPHLYCCRIEVRERPPLPWSHLELV